MPGGWLRLVWRTPDFILHIGLGVVSAAWLSLDSALGHRFSRYSDALIRWWIRRALKILGIRPNLVGTIPASGVLLVCNHVSWLDALLVGGHLRCRFLVKQEVGSWPIIGQLLRSAGSTFIARGANKNAAVNDNLQGFLQNGEMALIYPEATTTWGDEVSYFFPRLFKSAIAANAPVQPLAVSWGELERDGKRYRSAAPYTDDVNFIGNIRDMLMSPYTPVELRFLPAISSNGKGRDQLASETRLAIATSLGLPAQVNQKQGLDWGLLIRRLRRVPGSWKANYD